MFALATPLYKMRSGQSKMTILDAMIKNFRKGFSGDYGVKMTPGKLRTLSEVEWPHFEVEWPPEGTLDIQAVHHV